MSDSIYSNVFSQDLNAYKSAVKRGDFDLANIFANRMMSNAYLFNEKNLGLIGFILKEIAREGIIAKQLKDKSAPEIVTNQVQTLMKKDEILQTDNGLDEFWTTYRNIMMLTRKSKLTPDEISSYTSLNQDFTKLSTEKIINEFEVNMDLLKDPRNNLIRGSLSEIGRMIVCHGFEDMSFNVLCLLTMLARIYEYVILTSDEKNYPSRIEKEFFPLVLDVMKSIKSQDNKQIDSDLLWMLIKTWRLYFIKFAEMGRQSVRGEKKSVITEQSRSKIAEALSKSLEKEVQENVE